MKKVLSCLLVLCTILSVLPISAFALSWDGSSTGGTGGKDYAGAHGYAIRTSSDNCVGYRFSVVNSSGANKVAKVIDVFRDTGYGRLGYSEGYKFANKYNKKQLIGKQNKIKMQIIRFIITSVGFTFKLDIQIEKAQNQQPKKLKP